MIRYVWRDLTRNPRRTFTALVGVILGTALLAGVLFFVDGSAATMTRRAIAPLALDMQREVRASLGEPLRLQQRVAAEELPDGNGVLVSLTVTNTGDQPQHEVVVKHAPPPGFAYRANSTTRDGVALPDRGGDPPLAHGPARLGLNLGTLPPGASVTLSYRARPAPAAGSAGGSNAPVPVPVDGVPLDATVASRERPVPRAANQPEPLGLQELTARARRVPGVAAADALSFVDAPPGALAARGRALPEPVRVFAFAPSYRVHEPAIRLVAGGFDPAAALLSVEAARALGVGPGDAVQLTLPGAAAPTPLPVSGLLDLSGARALFWSRKTRTFEDFLYLPHSLVIGHDAFERVVVPAYRAAAATVGGVGGGGSGVASLPVSEVAIRVERAPLHADPGRALAQTQAIAERVRRLGPAEGVLVDNISNTLRVARDDARVGKWMFLFLGLPGAMLAAFLAAYAGSALASGQRRERAVLRLRGAHRGHLRRMLLARTLLFSALGALAGTALGFVSIVALLGFADLAAASAAALVGSALIAACVGAAVTSLALYLPGRRSLQREIGEENRELEAAREPGWRRWRLDLAALAIGAVGGGAALALGAFDTRATSVFVGRSAVLPSYLLPAPLLLWLGGALLGVRLVDAGARRVPLAPPPRYGPLLAGTLARSLRRRSRPLAAAAAGVALIVALGTALAIFAASYERARAADARFAVGADLRLTPSVTATRQRSPDAELLDALGIARVAPVLFDLENAVLIGPFDQNLQDLAAVDAAAFARVAPLADASLADPAAAEALASLAGPPRGVLVQAVTAEDLSIEVGDEVEILLARGAEQQALASFRVVGLFQVLPGFPQGVDLLIDLAAYRAATGPAEADFFLAELRDRSPAGLERALAAAADAAAAADPLAFAVESGRTALWKDQSSLTALNVRGLTTLATGYTGLMAAAVVAIFVFALVLQRRTEYATLHARGVRLAQLGFLLLAEALGVALAGVLLGLALGAAMAQLFVPVLRPLFVVDPLVTPDASLWWIAGAAPLAALVAALAATRVLAEKPGEALRET